MRLDGIHHVSCITGNAPLNLDFYTRVLGLRLVAKTVNQDDPFIYHLFYADEEGTPGADITFFEYPGAVRGRAGAGMVHRVAFRVADEGALDFWRDRLTGESVAVTTGTDGVGDASSRAAVRFEDPEGLGLELVVDRSGDPPLRAKHPDIPSEMAILGFDGVRAYGRDVAATRRVLEEVMSGARLADTDWELRAERRGGTIGYDPPPLEAGRTGAGTVHHVAWHAPTAEHPDWVPRLRAHGLHPTSVIDRHFFKSIYFREPSGVLFEIADDGPGFTMGGSVEDLGQELILPPAFEARRDEITERLTPLPDSRG